ncbi:YeeE/YedE family protein [Coralliovum pocilloporae]|uniref:YeeE/YedE family protein n=1 Tax=Coralliovum pocilloporae TaxID=3066369 RepID=UPI0033070AAA
MSDTKLQTTPLVVAFGLLVALIWAAAEIGSGRIASGAAIGAFAGIALYHAKFGFTAAWRRMVLERRGAGLRAQMILIGLSVCISFPLFVYGADVGFRTGGFVFPFGIAAAFGAFMFGLGMQFGGGCASGTLFTVGGGSTRMVITLAAFVAGSVIATAHLPEWQALPSLKAYSMVRQLGLGPALLLTLGLLGTIALLTIVFEKRSHGTLQSFGKTESFLKGPWSMLAGALALVIVVVATLLVLGRPWGITSAFALWGAKVFSVAGIEVETWPYWQNQVGRLNRSLLTDSTSVMNFGIILGALIAASLSGRFAPVAKIPPKEIATAIFGGLLMGYGARLAYGCNIGAYLGGLVSGSLHGWGWLVFGFIGSTVGSHLKALVDSWPGRSRQAV